MSSLLHIDAIFSGRPTQYILGCLFVVVFGVLVVAFRPRQTSQTRQGKTFTSSSADRTEVVLRATPRLRVSGGRPYNYVDSLVELREGLNAPTNQLGIGGTITYETGPVRTSTPPPWL